jgi:hypothetical protein
LRLQTALEASQTESRAAFAASPQTKHTSVDSDRPRQALGPRGLRVEARSIVAWLVVEWPYAPVELVGSCPREQGARRTRTEQRDAFHLKAMSRRELHYRAWQSTMMREPAVRTPKPHSRAGHARLTDVTFGCLRTRNATEMSK